jgi:multiple sugar transport system substrate-binding protein
MSTRVVRLVALAVVLVAGLTACSGSRPGTTSAGKTVLTFANWQWLEPGRGATLWQSMLRYQKSHPDVVFRKQAITRADYEKTLQTQIGAGGGPDVLIVPQALYAQLATADLLVPLSGVADDPHRAQETYHGRRLVYTWEVVNFGFFWNKKLLHRAGVQRPTDMPGLLAAARAVTAATGKPGFAVRSSTSELQPWWSDFGNFVYGYGGAWSRHGKLTIDDPHNVAAVAALKQLYRSGTMPVGDDASTFRSRFANGEIGMMFDNASVLFTILDGNKKLSADDVGVAPMPLPTDDSSQVTNFVGVSRNSPHQQAAMDFLRWLGSGPGQQAAARGIFPSLNATATAPPRQLTDRYPWIDAYRTQAKTAGGSPVIPGFELQTPQIATVVMQSIENVLVNDRDPAQALRDAQHAVEGLPS